MLLCIVEFFLSRVMCSKPNVRAIVTTGRSKFYCNGLDLNWLSEINSGVPEYTPTFLSRWYKLQHRILTCPVPTVAAINGNTFNI